MFYLAREHEDAMCDTAVLSGRSNDRINLTAVKHLSL